MTADELSAFVAGIRAEADARSAILRAIDRESLPPELRDEYDHALTAWTEMRALTDAETHALHLAASGSEGRARTGRGCTARLRRFPSAKNANGAPSEWGRAGG